MVRFDLGAQRRSRPARVAEAKRLAKLLGEFGHERARRVEIAGLLRARAWLNSALASRNRASGLSASASTARCKLDWARVQQLGRLGRVDRQCERLLERLGAFEQRRPGCVRATPAPRARCWATDLAPATRTCPAGAGPLAIVAFAVDELPRQVGAKLRGGRRGIGRGPGLSQPTTRGLVVNRGRRFDDRAASGPACPTRRSRRRARSPAFADSASPWTPWPLTMRNRSLIVAESLNSTPGRPRSRIRSSRASCTASFFGSNVMRSSGRCGRIATRARRPEANGELGGLGLPAGRVDVLLPDPANFLVLGRLASSPPCERRRECRRTTGRASARRIFVLSVDMNRRVWSSSFSWAAASSGSLVQRMQLMWTPFSAASDTRAPVPNAPAGLVRRLVEGFVERRRIAEQKDPARYVVVGRPGKIGQSPCADPRRRAQENTGRRFRTSRLLIAASSAARSDTKPLFAACSGSSTGPDGDPTSR